jgi:L-methionine (R)-S-oxide reductase
MLQHIKKPQDKQETYTLLVSQVKAILSDEDDMIANLANISAILFEFMEDINWVGFYLIKGDHLIVGPFQGKVACSRIPLYKGVCGKAAKDKKMVNIENVHQFQGHIACDSASNSEIVFPLIVNNNVIGVLDIDSPKFDRFDYIDEENLQKIVDELTKKLPDSR